MKKIKAIIEKANDGGSSVYSAYLRSRPNIIKKNMETFLCGISLGILLITYMI